LLIRAYYWLRNVFPLSLPAHPFRLEKPYVPKDVDWVLKTHRFRARIPRFLLRAAWFARPRPVHLRWPGGASGLTRRTCRDSIQLVMRARLQVSQDFPLSFEGFFPLTLFLERQFSDLLTPRKTLEIPSFRVSRSLATGVVPPRCCKYFSKDRFYLLRRQCLI